MAKEQTKPAPIATPAQALHAKLAWPMARAREFVAKQPNDRQAALAAAANQPNPDQAIRALLDQWADADAPKPTK